MSTTAPEGRKHWPRRLSEAGFLTLELRQKCGAGQHWNLAPGQHVIVVRPDKDRRIADQARWGLVPAWSKDPDTGPRPINARAETVASKPTFRDAFRHGRCLVPASGFYEWKAEGGRKQPMYIHPMDGGLLAFAGLRATCEGPEGPLHTVCVLTTTPNGLMAPIHDRMPVILPPEDWAAWLDPDAGGADLNALLVPCPAEALATHPVGPEVGNVRNDHPGLVAPLEAEPDGRGHGSR